MKGLKPRITLNNTDWHVPFLVLGAMVVLHLFFSAMDSRAKTLKINKLEQEIIETNKEFKYWLPPKGTGGRV